MPVHPWGKTSLPRYPLLRGDIVLILYDAGYSLRAIGEYAGVSHETIRQYVHQRGHRRGIHGREAFPANEDACALLHARCRLHLSQRAMARLLGYHWKTLSRYETGVGRMPPGLLALVQALALDSNLDTAKEN